ncbi:phosphatidylglycerophosphatase A [Wenzhouxiangella sp. XN79A]|uniref:phosphatidylglycerophosphatase A family protein n=1 Tax=Wenzhouxiangella sp. XN79A TaxID=2724193 RepID=UPI00144ACD4D|nr:phosphatidylglycerophosphatase A [Wenzhouxiangella sp. XN79A]NKI34289.1 phosphatidylglycerophosphatase A [Wenzhouxiangella sp. XN79A]
MTATAPNAKTTRAVALHDPIGFLAFGFGSGLSPRAPGTAGTAAGLLLALPLIGLDPVIAALVVGATFLVGIPICGHATRALGVHDHGGIVWDEFVGVWLVLLFVPTTPAGWLAAFVAFRVFDIAKPWPIGWLDRRVSGGLGIMIDDLVAALYAIAIITLIGYGLERLA